MLSKTSRRRPPRLSLWKSAQNCAESQVVPLARELAALLNPGDRVLLEGELGVGKTTFARALLEALGITQPPEGSPSFAIAHEYGSARGPVIHLDLYRIKDEAEIEEAGIPAYYWEREAIVISEWASMFPAFESSLMQERGAGNAWRVTLEFCADADRRSVEIQLLKRSS